MTVYSTALLVATAGSTPPNFRLGSLLIPRALMSLVTPPSATPAPLQFLAARRMPWKLGGLQISTIASAISGSVVVPAPTGTLSVDQPSIQLGDSITLTWLSNGADTIQAGGAWGGAKAAAGSQTLTPAQQGTAVYVLMIANDGGAELLSVNVEVGAPAPPPNITKVRGATSKNGAKVSRKVAVIAVDGSELLGVATSGATDGAYEVQLPVSDDVIVIGLPENKNEKPYTYRATPEAL